ncbi:hypothetical protein Hanom_Chr00s000928g01670601 [Helianthus anomalus]
MGLRQSRSLSNLCSLAKKKAIEDAIIQSCGLNIIEPVSNLVHTYWAFKSYVGSPSTIVGAAFLFSTEVCDWFHHTELPWEKFPDCWTREQVAGWASSCQFRDWMMKNYHRIIILAKDGIYAWYSVAAPFQIFCIIVSPFPGRGCFCIIASRSTNIIVNKDL